MKRLFVIGSVLALIATSAAAQNTSTTQMQLVASPTFTTRLQYLMVQQAAVVLNEAHSFPCHAARIQYAFSVLTSPAQMASNAAILVSGSNVGGAVIVGTVTLTGTPPVVDSSASDTALLTALVNGWNTLAKCDTGV